MKVDELRAFAIEELGEKLTGLKKILMELRFQSKTGKLETKNSIKATRRDVARILTVINEQKRSPISVPVKSVAVKKKKPVKAPAEKKVVAEKPVKKTPVKTSKK